MPTLSLYLPSPPPPMTSFTSTTTLSPFPSTLFTLHPPRPLLLSHHSHSLHPLLKPLPFPTLSLTPLSRFTPRAKFDSDYSNEAEEAEIADEYDSDDYRDEEEEEEDEDEDEDEEDEDEDEEDEDEEEYEDEEEDDKKDYEDEEEEEEEDEDEDLEIDLQRPTTETEEEIAMAYEEIYGPGWSGESFLGNDVLEMDSEIEPEKIDSWGMDEEEMKILDGFEERVLQVRRITKVVKGGKILRFRAIVVAGDKKGKVGVGHGKAVEVIDAVRKAALDARRHLVEVPMTKYMTFPHRVEAKFGAAKVMLRPAGPGTGVLAGRTIKDILELAGIQNAMAKQIGSPNVLNNARAAIVGISQMKTFSEVALQRGIPMEELWK